MNSKICSKCGNVREISEFRKDKTKKDGLRPDCKVCLKNYEKSSRLDKPTMMRDKLKKFYQDNPQKKKEYRENYRVRKQQQRKERRNIDPIFVIVNRVRCRIWKYLNNNKIIKKNTTFEIVGCSPEELKSYLEKQFVDGMTWENRKDWHIDHIIPLSTAKNENELYKLCHYTNLQPLWSYDNIKKSNKII
jgi:hypothetical protein